MHQLFKYPLLSSKVIDVYESTTHYELIISPLEKNFSISLGNLLRKIMLSYTIGFGIVGVRIKGVSNEFDSLSGIQEDVVQIIMNLKNITFSSGLSINKSLKMGIVERGPKTVYASSFTGNDNLKVLNQDVKICTITDTSVFSMEVDVASGVGYYSCDRIHIDPLTIPLDTALSPIDHISYATNSYSTYEELAIHIRTNGSVKPKEVFYHALALLKEKIAMLT